MIGEFLKRHSIPYLDYDGKYVWQCGKCDRRIFHPSFTDEDNDEFNYYRYCHFCGAKLDWSKRCVPFELTFPDWQYEITVKG